MNSLMRCPGSRRISLALIVAIALLIVMARAGFTTRADSQSQRGGVRPQATGLQGDVTQNASLVVDGALIGANLGSSGSPIDFSNPVKAHAIVVGDFNGDGILDVAIGAPDQTVQPASGPARTQAGAVYIVFGAHNLLGTPGSPHTVDTNTPASVLTIIGANPGDRLGFSLAAGAVEGGTSAGLVIGAPGFSANNTDRTATGAVFVISGGHAGTSTVLDLATADTADIEILGINHGDQFGASVAVADVGGLTSASAAEQEIADILVGAPGFAGPNVDRSNAGGLFTIFGGSSLKTVGGSTTLIDLASNTTPPDVEVVGAAAGDMLGTSVAAGDINVSLPADILVGAPNATRPAISGITGLPNTGAVYA
ncbi:MAG: FG-GAP repeat protein, partial [Blastocatellia bacterium]